MARIRARLTVVHPSTGTSLCPVRTPISFVRRALPSASRALPLSPNTNIHDLCHGIAHGTNKNEYKHPLQDLVHKGSEDAYHVEIRHQLSQND